MLHAKFQDRRTSGSGEEDFKGFSLLYMSVATILTIYTNFRSPFLSMSHIKFGFDWPNGFGGEDVLNG